MKRFFQPASIAVVGASPRRGGLQILENLQTGFHGAVYAVNPKYDDIGGIPCFSSPETIPHDVDLAILFVPAPAVPATLEACGRKGIQRVMIQSAGFAEVGDPGKAIQERCRSIAKEAGIRIWGPNCMGLVDIPRKYFFTFMHPSIHKDGLLPGRISLIVQSGMLSAGFLAVMRQRSIGVAKVCSIGNKVDVDECDLLDYLVHDPETDVIALYLESIPRGRQFAALAAGASKPIVLLKGGKTEAGAQAVLSHTSSLAGNSRLLEGVLQQAGVTLVRDFYQMMDTANALSLCPKVPAACRIAIVTFSGASGILSCDLLTSQVLRVAQFSPQTLKVLDDIFPHWMPATNPVDLYPAVELRGRIAAYERAVSAIMRDPNVDVVFVHYYAGLEDQIPDLRMMKQAADQEGKTLILWVLGLERSTRELREAAQRQGIAVFDEIFKAMESLSAVSRARAPAVRTVGSDIPPSPFTEGDGSFPELAPGHGPILDEYDGKRVLARAGIPTVPEVVVNTLEEAFAAAHRMGFPVVLKGLLPGQIHKSEKGLVKKDLIHKDHLEHAYKRIQSALAGQGRILLQQQMPTDLELTAGFIRDDQFGSCIMFGLGGIFAELEPDVVFGLAPITPLQALGLMGRLRGKPLVEGFRGLPPLMREKMAEILVHLGNLGTRFAAIRQIDINPLIVHKGITVAVDATIILTGEPGAAPATRPPTH